VYRILLFSDDDLGRDCSKRINFTPFSLVFSRLLSYRLKKAGIHSIMLTKHNRRIRKTYYRSPSWQILGPFGSFDHCFELETPQNLVDWFLDYESLEPDPSFSAANPVAPLSHPPWPPGRGWWCHIQERPIESAKALSITRMSAGIRPSYDPISPQIAMCGRTEWAERMCRKIEARRTRDMQERGVIGRTRSRSTSPAGSERAQKSRERRLDKAAAGLVSVKRTASRSASPDFRPHRERAGTFLQLVDEAERERLLRPLARNPDNDTHIPLKLRVLKSSGPPPLNPLPPTRSQNAPRERRGFIGILLRVFFGPLPVRRKERKRE